ncbi:MAG: hypothetical protein MZV64_63230 [Ignavibacteriales bacterium]|nr:hypothetical protein [Ignavibacteriales bacterium]
MACPSAQDRGSSLAGTQGVLRGDGPDGRVASRLARGEGPEARADGHGGRRQEPLLWPFLRLRRGLSSHERARGLSPALRASSEPIR